MDLEWLYTLDSLKAYAIDTKQGKERLEVFIKNLPGMLTAANVELPKKPKILYLMAGSCIEGIAFGQHYKTEVTCLDLQRRMLGKGEREAKKRKLKLRTVVGNATELVRHVSDSFDLITILGSPLAHINIFEFDKIVSSAKAVLETDGSMLVDQSDMIFRILPRYSDAFIINQDPPVISVHSGFDATRGCFERVVYGKAKHVLDRVYLWGPWIVKYVLEKNGLATVTVKPYSDPYFMAQTYLYTARR